MGVREKPSALYKSTARATPRPPWWIRGSADSSPAPACPSPDGSNDGQKGMGLIMLILVCTLPMAYALNRTMPEEQALAVSPLSARSSPMQDAGEKYTAAQPPPIRRAGALRLRGNAEVHPQLIPALAALTGHIGE